MGCVFAFVAGLIAAPLMLWAWLVWDRRRVDRELSSGAPKPLVGGDRDAAAGSPDARESTAAADVDAETQA